MPARARTYNSQGLPAFVWRFMVINFLEKYTLIKKSMTFIDQHKRESNHTDRLQLHLNKPPALLKCKYVINECRQMRSITPVKQGSYSSLRFKHV